MDTFIVNNCIVIIPIRIVLLYNTSMLMNRGVVRCFQTTVGSFRATSELSSHRLIRICVDSSTKPIRQCTRCTPPNAYPTQRTASPQSSK